MVIQLNNRVNTINDNLVHFSSYYSFLVPSSFRTVLVNTWTVHSSFVMLRAVIITLNKSNRSLVCRNMHRQRCVPRVPRENITSMNRCVHVLKRQIEWLTCRVQNELGRIRGSAVLLPNYYTVWCVKHVVTSMLATLMLLHSPYIKGCSGCVELQA